MIANIDGKTSCDLCGFGDASGRALVDGFTETTGWERVDTVCYNCITQLVAIHVPEPEPGAFER